MSNGRFLSELRRSNASGIHGKCSSDRYNNNRKAVEEELRMSVVDDIGVQEPTTDDLDAIEASWDSLCFPPEVHYYSDPDAYPSYSLLDDDGYEYYDDEW